MYTIKETGQKIDLKQRLDSGGEGAIWLTDLPEVVAKIYHTPRHDYETKVLAMVKNPPEDPTKSQNHISIAWPQGTIQDDQGQFCGFIMPRVSGSLRVNHVYNTKLRKRNAPGFNWHYLHVTAYNIASILEALHKKGYVVGDIKTDNFMINDRALVALTDADSFQIQQEGVVYRCPVGSEGFTPSELIGKNLADVDRTEVHDRFGLAIMIHLLLLGYHPFSGEWPEGEEPESRDDAILKGEWPYAPNAKVQSPMYALPQEILHPKIRAAFLQTFNDGFVHPNQRLSAADWKAILTEAVQNLTTCPENSQHFLSGETCFWCSRKQITGVDVFPAVKGYARTEDVVKLEQAIKTEDMREIARIWNTNTDLHKESRFSVQKEEIKKACDYIQVLDQFKEFCLQSKSDQEILDWWSTDDKLSYFPLAPTERVNGKPLKEFLEEIRRRRQSLSKLKESVAKADKKDSFGDPVMDEDFEREILEVYAHHQWPESIKSAEPEIFDRVVIARQRIESWRAFKEAYDKGKHATGLRLWEANKKTYQKFGMTDGQKKFIQDARIHKSAVDTLKDLVNKQDVMVDVWWGKHPSLHRSDFLEEIFDGTSFKNHILQAQKRQDLLKKFQKANEKSDLQALAKLWNSEICEGRPEFEIFLPKIKVAETLASTWRKVYRAIQEDQVEIIVENWEEEKFAPLIEDPIKAERVRRAFQTYYRNVHFKESNWQKITDEKDFITARWKWPESNARIPNCLITVSATPTPAHYNDQNCLYRCLVEKRDLMGQTRIPKLRSGPLFIHVWPATVVCGRPLLLGDAFTLKDKNFSAIAYDTKVKKAKWRGFGKGYDYKVLLKVKSENTNVFPRMRLIATEDRFPCYKDSQSIIIGEIPPCDLQAGKSNEMEIRMSQKLNKNWQYRLEIIDPVWENKLQLLHPYKV